MERGTTAAMTADTVPMHQPPPGYEPSQPLQMAIAPDSVPHTEVDSHATGRGDNFPRLIWWSILSAFIPGSGLIATKRWLLGTVALVTWTLVISASLTLATLTNPKTLPYKFAGYTQYLSFVAITIIGLGLFWAFTVLVTFSISRRYARLSTLQRAVSYTLITGLIALILIPTGTAGVYALRTRDTADRIFGGDQKSDGTWTKRPRVNVLLMGSDAGADRTGIRPDTMILASIDTRTGNTVLFSLPRNLERVPFPPRTQQAVDYPHGYYGPFCLNERGVNTECLLNSFWTFGEANWKKYYAQEPSAYDAGLRATEDAIQMVTGLKIDNYVMINLRGFQQLVDAFGGVTVNVTERLPIGGSSEHPVPIGGWIEPGANQRLDGYHALWFARSRWSTNDYSRMSRQRCVIAALSKEVNPSSIVANYLPLMDALADNIETDIGQTQLEAWARLAEKVQKAKVRSLPFTGSVIDPTNPDFVVIRDLVQQALNAPTTPATSKPATPGTSATPGLKNRPSQADTSPSLTTHTQTPDTAIAEDVTNVC